MPLSSPAPREHLHSRTVTCQGFRREDGLWDIEGHLIDRKTYDFANYDRGGAIPAGSPVHEMWVRVTLDDDLLIHAIEVVTDHSPFRICPEITSHFGSLKGTVMSSGFLREVKNRFGGTKGCTHIIELMAPVATAAFQTIAPLVRKGREDKALMSIIDSCHALAADGPVVARAWPAFARPKGTEPHPAGE